MFGGLDEIEKYRLGVEDDRPTTCPECGNNVVDNINHMIDRGNALHLLKVAGDNLAKAARSGEGLAQAANDWELAKEEAGVK